MSDDQALREMSHAIGGLESTVKSMVSTWQQQEASASQGRRDLHHKFDAMRDELHQLGTKVAGALDDIAELKPSVKAFENAKAQAQGAQTLGKWIWGAIGLAGTGLGWALANWISITPKPPLH